MKLTARCIVQVAADAVSCLLDGEAAILNVKSGEYYGLDEIGALVWRMIGQQCTISEIVPEITSVYEVEPAQCESDVISLIRKLAEHGLVEIHNKI